jgi:DNA (cytosine-5)-methyltransferase 1
MRYASVCSGIEAPSVAWEPLGWRPQFFSEIEAFPSAVLAHQYGSNMPGDPLPSNGVPNHGDMTNFKEWPDAAIDVLVGGTPCQSFSVAGLRAGLADPRGNLALTFLAIADRYRPRWILWENVPGVLSSGEGRDFGAFLGALGQLGYGWAYRVVDAQYCRVDGFGRAVPQRRRRVFVVGCLGSWAGAAAVLFEPEGLRGHSPPRREAGQGATYDVVPSLTASGRGVERSGETRGQDPVVAVSSSGSVAHCLNAGGMGRQDYESETMIAHSLRGEGFDASEYGTGRGTPLVPVAPTLRAEGNSTGGDRPYGTDVDTCDSLIPIAPPFAATLTRGAESAGKGGYAGRRQEDDVNLVAAPIAFAQNSRDEVRMFGGDGQTVGALAAEPGMKQTTYVAHQWAVRRLTPVECARLQGFPDDYLDVMHRGKSAADGPKYKALGNSMAVPVIRWIGKRIDAVDKIMRGGRPMTGITGDEAWLETPAGRAWKPLFDRLPDGFRWAPEQVGKALVDAERVIAASTGRVGPRQSGSVLGALVGGGSPGLRFLPNEVTWAQAVVLWPRTYLLDEEDPAHRRIERHAIRLWLRKKSGETLTHADRLSLKARAHYDARKRGFLYIATGLMRDRVAVPGDDVGDTDSQLEHARASVEREPVPAAWHDEEAEPVSFRHDETAEETQWVAERLARKVRAALAEGADRTEALDAAIDEQLAAEYINAPQGHRRDVAMSKRASLLSLLVIRQVLKDEREARETADQGG